MIVPHHSASLRDTSLLIASVRLPCARVSPMVTLEFTKSTAQATSKSMSINETLGASSVPSVRCNSFTFRLNETSANPRPSRLQRHPVPRRTRSECPTGVRHQVRHFGPYTELLTTA